MGGAPVLPGWDTFVLALPIVGLLGMMMFGLDEQCANPQRRHGARRSFCEVGGKGPAILTDPDGRIWQGGGVIQIEARLIRTAGEEGRSGRPVVPHASSEIRGYVSERM
jgi:hypothetical protein